MTDPLRLAEILCARFCHDFSGVLGSLMGAIELARDEPQANAEALSVGADAAVVLAKRLRLLRAAWAGDCGPLAPAQLAALGEGLSFGKPIRLDLLGAGPRNDVPARGGPVSTERRLACRRVFAPRRHARAVRFAGVRRDRDDRGAAGGMAARICRLSRRRGGSLGRADRSANGAGSAHGASRPRGGVAPLADDAERAGSWTRAATDRDAPRRVRRDLPG